MKANNKLVMYLLVKCVDADLLNNYDYEKVPWILSFLENVLNDSRSKTKVTLGKFCFIYLGEAGKVFPWCRGDMGCVQNTYRKKRQIQPKISEVCQEVKHNYSFYKKKILGLNKWWILCNNWRNKQIWIIKYVW